MSTYRELKANLPVEEQNRITLEAGFYIVVELIRRGKQEDAFNKIKQMMTVLGFEIDEEFFK